MDDEGTGAGESFGTFVALKRTFAGVFSIVQLEARLVNELLVALATIIFSRVRFHVNSQRVLGRATLLANFAFVHFRQYLFYYSVDSAIVVAQSRLPHESFAAALADEGFHAQVKSRVVFEVAVGHETFSTLFTSERMFSKVHSSYVTPHCHFARLARFAIVANVFDTFVKPPVSLKGTFSLESLVAQITHESLHQTVLHDVRQVSRFNYKRFAARDTLEFPTFFHTRTFFQ